MVGMLKGEAIDASDSPIGKLTLFAFVDGNHASIGVRAQSGEGFGAIGLGTGSRHRDISVTSALFGDWAVVWGGISPRAARAEVRNELGQAFEARIVHLPRDFARGDRAVWGLALPCHEDPTVVGFDEEGNQLGH
jgi:hypothetical protein